MGAHRQMVFESEGELGVKDTGGDKEFSWCAEHFLAPHIYSASLEDDLTHWGAALYGLYQWGPLLA